MGQRDPLRAQLTRSSTLATTYSALSLGFERKDSTSLLAAMLVDFSFFPVECKNRACCATGAAALRSANLSVCYITYLYASYWRAVDSKAQKKNRRRSWSEKTTSEAG